MQTRLPTLPARARIPINRCNLPADILGGLSFCRHPVALTIDGTDILYRDLFQHLDAIENPELRIRFFHDYMTVHFSLHEPERAGHCAQTRLDRSSASYRRLIRGWFFDSEGRDGAVLRGWVESRFGLLPRFHNGRIDSGECENYRHYLHARTAGLYNTNALEAQLDVLYTWCQYELRRRGTASHLVLYRGINRRDELEVLGHTSDGDVILLNNLSSFSADPELAGELGAYLLKVHVPREKILLYPDLTTGLPHSEEEYLVIGGLCEASEVDISVTP